MIGRYSSRRAPLGGFLGAHLHGARGYDRIAGYFSSSIVEVAGEALDAMADGAVARVVCNSSLDPLDVATAKAAKLAMHREWCAWLPEDVPPPLKARLLRLYDFLASGRLQVRVLPDARFGLIHGKAGTIIRADGRPLCFIGSANESKSAWTLNYELVWTDESPEGVQWVREEFEALWMAPDAAPLADAVIQDVERQTRRVVIPAVAQWRAEPVPDPAAPIVELPVYRREDGLWAHQKYFVEKAFAAHRAGGARYVLADQVGLGKTIQLALAAKLMMLWGGGPVLALVPKPLLQQWQDECWNLLALPSAIWNGQQWVDEQGVAHAARGLDELSRCPRRLGIVSSGLVTQSPEARDRLLGRDYECVLVDEAHRARRRNRGPRHRNEPADPNHLLAFLRVVAARTKSLLLATATPVQMDPIEAWDLLDVLSVGNDGVLGSAFSRWRTRARQGLDLVLGREPPPTDLHEAWEWIRDPLSLAGEHRDFAMLRSSLNLELAPSAPPEALDRLRAPELDRVRRMAERFFAQHNPFIRHMVRRTREHLEQTLDPRTHEPYLPAIRVHLYGERPEESLTVPPFMHDAYEAAQEFCALLGQRPGLNAGFLETILLRRIGSTIFAGQRTAGKMLGSDRDLDDEDDADEENDDLLDRPSGPPSSLHPFAEAERAALQRVVDLLGRSPDEDPKAHEVERILLGGVDTTGPWLDRGCIVFSQYYDSVYWLAGRLSARLPDEPVAIYAGAARSGVMRAGVFTRLSRDAIKAAVRADTIRLVLGTDAASEGLNLQRLGTLINLDLPWNPSRLEQRKGRIQRIGQLRPEVLIYNLRYRGSVEDRVHELLSQRLEAIRDMFGQVPDTLEDVWVQVAVRDEAKAREVIDAVPVAHPFELKYDRAVAQIDWESCARVLDAAAQLDALIKRW